MLVRQSFEASTFGDHVLRYRCVHCFHETTARAFGCARSVGWMVGLDAGAETRTYRRQLASAMAQAALSIRIAPCPRCHRHDRKAVRTVYRTTLWSCTAMLAAPIAVLAWSGQRWTTAVLVGLTLGAVPAMLWWKHRSSQLTATHVRFD